MILAQGSLMRGAPDWRTVTLDDLNILFNVAQRRPVKSHFSAEIERTSMPPIPQAGELLLDPDQVKRWRTMHERKEPDVETKNVRQWYARWYFRTDENYISIKGKTGKMFERVEFPLRIMELFDASLSPYNRFIFNEHARSIQVDRHPGRRMWADDLWAASCMDPDLLHPILNALTILNPDERVELARNHFFSIEALGIDSVHADQLIAGTSPHWAAVIRHDDALESLRVKLTGLLALKLARYDVEATYLLERRGRSYVLVAGRVENRTLGTVFTSERSHFDSELVARQWVHSRLAADGRFNSAKIQIHAVDTSESWTEQEVFAPATAETHPSYRISDITTGKAIPVYQPKWRQRSELNSHAMIRTTIITLCSVGLIATAMFIYARHKRPHAMRLLR